MRSFVLGLASVVLFSCGASKSIEANWVDDVKGDFSFKDKWNYSENIFKNDAGQLVCDGMCPEECDRMRDSTGKIIPDSANAYYKLVDTSHVFHSIDCEAWCYEFSGTNDIDIERKNDTVICRTRCNASTHCSLNLEIVKNQCNARIVLISILPNGSASYSCSSGTIQIDETLWKKGIMKAMFDLSFENPQEKEKELFWKGKIYAPIN